MTSHTYELSPRELWISARPTLVALIVLAALLHGGAALNWLPAPRPALDIDRAILLHQADASLVPQDAQVLLIGDSSCMMNVNAEAIGRALHVPCLNLGTLSFLDLANYRQLLEHYLKNNAEQLTTVVLLMNPEALRRFGADPVYRQLMDDYFAGRDSAPPPTWNGHLRQVLGLHRLQGRLLARAVPAPLPGAFGPEYGFTRDLDHYLTRHHGSALDPTRQPFTGNPEYALHPNLETMSRDFRRTLPRNIRLVLGITPLPDRFVAENYRDDYQSMLRQWSDWIEADQVLFHLPPTLPEGLFATKTHLNPEGVAEFTRLLGDALAAWEADRKINARENQ